MSVTWIRIGLRRVARPYNLLLAGALVVVALLGIAGLAVAQGFSMQAQRAAARSIEGPQAVAAGAQQLLVRDTAFTLVAVWDRIQAADSLGVDPSALPAPGQTRLSDPLWDELGTAAGPAVEARLPGHLSGGLDQRLLLGPDEKVAFSGMRPQQQPPDHLAGGGAGPRPPTVGLGVIMALLLVPAASMVFVAARFDQRGRRRVLADLRALGASRRQLRVVILSEAMVMASGAVVAAALLWRVVRSWVGSSGLLGVRFFAADLGVPALGVAAVAAAVVIIGAVAALHALDQLDLATAIPGEADSDAPEPAVLWSAGLLAAGIVGLHVTAAVAEGLGDLQLGLLEVVFLALAAVGLVRAGPHLLAGIGRLLAGRGHGGVAGLLAGRRLEVGSRQAFRAAAGVVVVGFAFGGFAALDLSPARADAASEDGQVTAASSDLWMADLNGHAGQPLMDALHAEGLQPTGLAYRRVEHASLVAFSTCSQLRSGLNAQFSTTCRPGRAYRTPDADHRTIGSRIDLGQEGAFVGEATVAVAGAISLRADNGFLGGLDAVIPVREDQLERASLARVVVSAPDSATRLAADRATARTAPLALTSITGQPPVPEDGLAQASTAGRAALAGGLLLAGAALAIAAADAALRRRETAALLFAAGVSRRVRLQTVAAEVGLPLAVAALPGLLLGFELVYVGGSIIGGQVRVPWTELLAATAGTGVVAAAATATTMAFIARLPTTAILQAEH